MAAPISVHASAGRLIGKACDNPYEAFALGFLSHIAMDVAPYHQAGINWDDWQSDTGYMSIEVGGLVAVSLASKSPVERAGVLGAVMPDVVDAIAALVTGDKYALPLHKHFSWYVPSPQLNKAQSELYCITVVSISIKF